MFQIFDIAPLYIPPHSKHNKWIFINLQMSFNTSSGRPIASVFRRVDLPGVGEGVSHCPGVRNTSEFRGEINQKTISISQALVRLRPENAGEGGTVVKRVPCVERGLDNFRSIRWERKMEFFCLSSLDGNFFALPLEPQELCGFLKICNERQLIGAING